MKQKAKYKEKILLILRNIATQVKDNEPSPTPQGSWDVTVTHMFYQEISVQE